jgi:hypothetical protein
VASPGGDVVKSTPAVPVGDEAALLRGGRGDGRSRKVFSTLTAPVEARSIPPVPVMAEMEG